MAASSYARRQGSVLVVDDNREFVAALLEMLEDEGFVAIGAAHVDEALQHLEHDTVDVVLSDIEMPVRSGLDLVAELAQRRRQVPVVLMTGSRSEWDAGRRSGAFGCLLKPLDSGALVEQLRAALAFAQGR